MASERIQEVISTVKEITMKQAGLIILESLFHKFQGANPDLDARLHTTYKKRYGYEMMKMLPTDGVRAVSLEGPSGHGKTSVHEWANREFCELMGMRFMKNPSLKAVSSGQIGLNDYIYIIAELAGATSPMEVGGLPAKMTVKMGDGEVIPFMGHLQDWRLAATSMSGYAYVHYDDYSAANHQVQNAMLGTLLNGKSSNVAITMNDLVASANSRENASTVAIGVSGNQGNIDGTKIYDITNSTADRLIRFRVRDTLEDFCNRTFAAKTDEISDAGICGFLVANKEFFAKMTYRENGMLGQSCTPRGWDAMTTQMRLIAHANGGMTGIANMNEEKQLEVMNRILIASGGIVSQDASVKLASYYSELFVGAEPIAAQIINDGIIDEQRIAQKYGAGDAAGMSASALNFGYSLATSLASHAVTAMCSVLKEKKEQDKFLASADFTSPPAKKFREIMSNFSLGIKQIKQGTIRSLAIDHMTRRMSGSLPQLFTNNGAYRIPTQHTAGAIWAGMFADTIARNKEEFSEGYMFDIRNTLTQSGGFQDAMKHSQQNSFAKKTGDLATSP